MPADIRQQITEVECNYPCQAAQSLKPSFLEASLDFMRAASIVSNACCLGRRVSAQSNCAPAQTTVRRRGGMQQASHLCSSGMETTAEHRWFADRLRRLTECPGSHACCLGHACCLVVVFAAKEVHRRGRTTGSEAEVPGKNMLRGPGSYRKSTAG